MTKSSTTSDECITQRVANDFTKLYAECLDPLWEEAKKLPRDNQLRKLIGRTIHDTIHVGHRLARASFMKETGKPCDWFWNCSDEDADKLMERKLNAAVQS